MEPVHPEGRSGRTWTSCLLRWLGWGCCGDSPGETCGGHDASRRCAAWAPEPGSALRMRFRSGLWSEGFMHQRGPVLGQDPGGKCPGPCFEFLRQARPLLLSKAVFEVRACAEASNPCEAVYCGNAEALLAGTRCLGTTRESGFLYKDRSAAWPEGDCLSPPERNRLSSYFCGWEPSNS